LGWQVVVVRLDDEEPPVSSTTAAPESNSGYDAAEEFLEHRTPAQRVQTLLHQYPWLSPGPFYTIGA
jgi:hypothetical protein